MKDRYIAFSLPTGIGADTGGFAGDIGAIVREFSQYFKVIVNPNAVNGGILSAINKNMFYTEGYAFDNFLCAKLNLNPVLKRNKTGVVFDKAIPDSILNVHLNTLNALKVVQGLDIMPHVVTKKSVGVEFSLNGNISSGTLKNPETLLEAAKSLTAQGADVIAAVCFFGEDADDEDYSNGCGIDPIGGVEAIISHLIVKELNIPCAHAPAFFDIDISKKLENPKVASECISSTYLPCVIQGLEYAPHFVCSGGINVCDIEYLIVPDNALGSKAVFGALENNIKICAVKNPSKLDVGCEKLKISDILRFDTYKECLCHIKKNRV